MSTPVQLRLEEVRLAPGQEWTTESGTWRFICLRSGNAYWLDATKPLELKLGELLIISPKLKGVIRASQLGLAFLHWFAFDPSSIFGFFSLAERHWLESSVEGVLGSITCLPSTNTISKEMTVLLDSYSRECELVGRGKSMILALRILTQKMKMPQLGLQHGCAPKVRFQQIISRMPDSELIQHNSEELARLCGCTPRHFTRMFRRRFGAPARVRQAELRLIKARQLLEDSAKPVAEIAKDCGYRSLSLFNSLFRRRFGMSPSQLRNRTSSQQSSEDCK